MSNLFDLILWNLIAAEAMKNTTISIIVFGTNGTTEPIDLWAPNDSWENNNGKKDKELSEETPRGKGGKDKAGKDSKEGKGRKEQEKPGKGGKKGKNEKDNEDTEKKDEEPKEKLDRFKPDSVDEHKVNSP